MARVVRRIRVLREFLGVRDEIEAGLEEFFGDALLPAGMCPTTRMFCLRASSTMAEKVSSVSLL